MADTPYLRLDQIIREYVQRFEYGDEQEYTPSDFERAMIEDAIHGLICQENFMETILEARKMTHEARKAEGQHQCCGAGLEHPHYNQCINAPSRSEKQA